ncbi:MAG: hypothetical protein K0S20_149 [Patescibacteria group bacterium]|jgi:septal ring factor EnvC (AmiA/AmiB activator)|nr:hypothetical protein [Patescibacteria group bacterium]
MQIHSEVSSSPVLRYCATLFTVLAVFSACSFSSYGMGTVERVQAATVDQLNREKAELEARQKAAQQQAQAQKSVAQRAAEKVQEVSSQINQIQGSITSTTQNMAQTQAQIAQKNQEVAELEGKLRSYKDTQDLLVRNIYMLRMSMPDQLMLFSDQPISKREQDQAQFEAMKKSLASIYEKTNSAKLAVEGTRADLVRHSEELQSQKIQQEEQRLGLASVKQDQARLQENAEEAVVALEQRAQQARIELAKKEQQISAALTAAINANRGGISSNAAQGKRVRRGEIVGHLGSTGNSTGPHVHFEVRVNNSPVNPRPYVSNGTLSWPVSNYVISQEFGVRGATSYYDAHTGMDLAGPYGQPVRAPADGTVILNQYYGGYGYAWAQQLDNGLVVLLGHMTGK